MPQSSRCVTRRCRRRRRWRRPAGGPPGAALGAGGAAEGRGRLSGPGWGRARAQRGGFSANRSPIACSRARLCTPCCPGPSPSCRLQAPGGPHLLPGEGRAPGAPAAGAAPRRISVVPPCWGWRAAGVGATGAADCAGTGRVGDTGSSATLSHARSPVPCNGRPHGAMIAPLGAGGLPKIAPGDANPQGTGQRGWTRLPPPPPCLCEAARHAARAGKAEPRRQAPYQRPGRSWAAPPPPPALPLPLPLGCALSCPACS